MKRLFVINQPDGKPYICRFPMFYASRKEAKQAKNEINAETGIEHYVTYGPDHKKILEYRLDRDNDQSAAVQ